MLIDPTFTRPDPALALIFAIMGNGDGPQRLDRGFYTIGHWNFENLIAERTEGYGSDIDAKFDRLEALGLGSDYGVCDTPEQFMERFGAALDAASDRYVVSFCIVRKEDQDPAGGWRWHKWGPYIGTKDPQCEYLYDEGPEITQATTFQVYRLI